jgi:SAM-dependent methyltransferase
MRDMLIAMARAWLPAGLRQWVVDRQRQYRLQWPRMGSVDLGALRRLTPISPIFGIDRGLPIERYYIEHLLSMHSTDIRGRVLEIGDDRYTRAFGGASVTKSDVLHIVAGTPGATIIADLTSADDIPGDTFDCVIATQTLQMIYEVRAAIRHLYRMLKPGGVLLITWHGLSKIGRHEGVDPWGEYWHLTSQAARRLFSEVFPISQLEVRTYGNVLTAITVLHGLASEELDRAELDHHDRDYEVLVTVRAVKPMPAS